MGEVNAILGNGCGIQAQSSVATLLGSILWAWFFYRNLVLGISCFRWIKVAMSKWPNAKHNSVPAIWGRFPGGETFQCWYCKPSVKKQRGRDRIPIFVICVVRSVIFVGCWVVMAWTGKSCLGPAEISPVFLVQSKDGGCRMSSIFHLFVADANEGKRDVRWVQDQG